MMSLIIKNRIKNHLPFNDIIEIIEIIRKNSRLSYRIKYSQIKWYEFIKIKDKTKYQNCLK